MKPQLSMTSMLLATISLIFTQTCWSEEEQLPPIEHGDRFAYWVLLKTRNLAEDVRSMRDNDALYDLYTGISINLKATSELAIISLERSASKEAYRGLAYLTLINLDGAISEAHACAVIGKGKTILPYLNEARRASSVGRCVIKEEFEVQMKPGLCRLANEVTEKIDSYT